jgi:hypothetical protein
MTTKVFRAADGFEHKWYEGYGSKFYISRRAWREVLLQSYHMSLTSYEKKYHIGMLVGLLARLKYSKLPT